MFATQRKNFSWQSILWGTYLNFLVLVENTQCSAKKSKDQHQITQWILKKIVTQYDIPNWHNFITNVLFLVFFVYIHFKEKKECFFAKIKKTFPGTIQNIVFVFRPYCLKLHVFFFANFSWINIMIKTFSQIFLAMVLVIFALQILYW